VSELEPLSEIICPGCGGQFTAQTRLGPFTLSQIAGSGGMGVVYKAYDPSLDRPLALKVLRRDHAGGPELVEKLAREAAITAAINHPHVVKVYSTGYDAGRFYIAMELVDKGSLDDLITAQGPIAEVQVLQIGIQIASGLKAAYQFGLIHRDVKPGNILFGSVTDAKIVDFGLALTLEQEAAARGDVWGTPYYIAPEKLDGKPEDLRSDIYSLGGTLFHALTGRPPFEAESASLVALKHLKAQPVSIQTFAPGVSGRTAYVINRSLAKDPEKRYQSYDDLITHLEYARTELLASAGRRRSKSPFVFEGGAQGRVLGLGALVMLLLTLGGIAFYIRTNQRAAKSAVGSAARTVSPLEAAVQPLGRGDMAACTAALEVLVSDKGAAAPQKQLTLFCLGITRLAEGRMEQARTHFKAVARSKPEVFPSSPSFGSTLVRVAGLLSGAEDLNREAIGTVVVSGPENLLLIAYALRLWQDGRIEDSIPLLREFRACKPNDNFRWIAELKPLAETRVEDFTRFKMTVDQMRAADNGDKRRAFADELRKFGPPLSSRVKEAFESTAPKPAPSPTPVGR